MTQPLTTTAADWLLRLRDPEISPAQIGEWLAWCEASPENKKEFTALQALWHQVGVVEEEPIDPAALQADDYRGQVAVTDWLAPSAPARIRPAPRRAWLSLAAAVALVTIVASLWWTNRSVESRGGNLTVATATGVNKDVVLLDGSTVAVAAGSSLFTRFSERERHVFLTRGEAFFQVEKDPNRPFIVHALDAAVTAVGTAFNVRTEEGIVKVAVTEGTVKVERARAARLAAGKDIRLNAGQQVTLAASHPQPVVVAVEAERAAAWRFGTLQFVDEPLFSVVAAINRYADVPIRLSDEELGGQHYTGTVVTDRVNEWLRGLPNVFPVAVREGGGTEILIESLAQERS